MACKLEFTTPHLELEIWLEDEWMFIVLSMNNKYLTKL